jgi:hypothetical protein
MRCARQRASCREVVPVYALGRVLCARLPLRAAARRERAPPSVRHGSALPAGVPVGAGARVGPGSDDGFDRQLLVLLGRQFAVARQPRHPLLIGPGAEVRAALDEESTACRPAIAMSSWFVVLKAAAVRRQARRLTSWLNWPKATTPGLGSQGRPPKVDRPKAVIR